MLPYEMDRNTVLVGRQVKSGIYEIGRTDVKCLSYSSRIICSKSDHRRCALLLGDRSSNALFASAAHGTNWLG
jgi:hypothetical protein